MAKTTKEKQELGMPLCTISRCTVSIRNFYDRNNYTCTFGLDTEYVSCRYLPGVSIIPSSLSYGREEKVNLVAYPIKEGAPYADIMSVPENAVQTSRDNCDSLRGWVAAATDNVGYVVFCMEPR